MPTAITHPGGRVRRARADTGHVQQFVYEELKRALMSGHLAAGQTLKIRDIAQELGVSTMPVRGAIQQLVAESVLEARPNRSARVPTINQKRFDDLFAILLELEGMAAERAAPRIGAAQLAELEALFDAMARHLEARDAEAYLKANGSFHMLIYAIADSAPLLRLIENLWLQISPYFNEQLTDRDLTLRLNDQHEALLGALRAGDGSAARRAIVADLTYAARTVKVLLDLEAAKQDTTR